MLKSSGLNSELSRTRRNLMEHALRGNMPGVKGFRPKYQLDQMTTFKPFTIKELDIDLFGERENIQESIMREYEEKGIGKRAKSRHKGDESSQGGRTKLRYDGDQFSENNSVMSNNSRGFKAPVDRNRRNKSKSGFLAPGGGQGSSKGNRSRRGSDASEAQSIGMRKDDSWYKGKGKQGSSRGGRDNSRERGQDNSRDRERSKFNNNSNKRY
jgi:hypothetical protein